MSAGGKQRRQPGWQPTTNKEYLRKLLSEAQRIGGQELQNFNALLEGNSTPAQLGLTGVRLSVEEEALLIAKGDTTETWETIEEVKGVVVQLSSDGNVRLCKADKFASAPAAASTASASAATPPATMCIKGVQRPMDLDAPR